MGDPKDDPTAHERAAADAELARQDKVNADQLALSESNLRTMAAELGQEGYGDASVVLTRVARQQHDEAARHSKRGEHFQEASKEWEHAAVALEAQASFTGQALVGVGWIAKACFSASIALRRRMPSPPSRPPLNRSGQSRRVKVLSSPAGEAHHVDTATPGGRRATEGRS